MIMYITFFWFKKMKMETFVWVPDRFTGLDPVPSVPRGDIPRETHALSCLTPNRTWWVDMILLVVFQTRNWGQRGEVSCPDLSPGPSNSKVWARGLGPQERSSFQHPKAILDGALSTVNANSSGYLRKQAKQTKAYWTRPPAGSCFLFYFTA